MIMKRNIRLTIGYAAVLIVLIGAILLLGVILQVISMDSLQDSMVKVAAVVAVIISALLVIFAITYLVDKD